jgi:hypothetical protein
VGSAGIIAAMTERGLPSADASPACPFVAFEDERDERADRPDHRHRCFAESEPAPRALAHQEAYCLSSAFPVCPTFQEWARREAAHTRAGGTAMPTPAPATVSSSGAAEGGGPEVDGSSDAEDADDWERRRDERPIEERPRRNPPRDWAAPPPWAGGLAGGAGAGAAGAAGSGADPRQGPAPGAPDFLASRQAEGRGLAGSAADRLARDVAGPDPDDDDVDEPRGRSSSDHPSTGADPDLAGLVRGSDREGPRGGRDGSPPVARSGRPPTVSSTRDRDRERERERERDHARAADGPAWEGQRRYEAYPQIRPGRSMPGMPALPRIVVLAGALAIAALALFFLPGLLGVGSNDNPPVATPSPSVAPTATPEPTPVPAPTPQVYVIKEGDTLTKIAQANGLTLDELLAANQDTITNPNRISVGDEIVIPVPVTDGGDGGTASASPAPSP